MMRVNTNRVSATVSVHCSNELHKVVFTTESSDPIRYAHDHEVDTVMASLGAEPHPCRQAVIAYQAARIAYDAAAGTTEPDMMTLPFTACALARCTGNAGHQLSASHQAAQLGVFDRDAARSAGVLYRWLCRQNPLVDVDDRAEDWAIWGLRDDYREALTALARPDEVATLGRLVNGTRSARDSFLPIQWVKAVATHVNTLGRPAPANAKLRALVNARHVDPALAATYLARGVNSNIAFYASRHITARDVLTYYRAVEGRNTLARRLRDGATPTEAFTEVGLRYQPGH